MNVKTLDLDGKRWVLLPETEYKRLATRAADAGWPTLPDPDTEGNVAAVDYARASLARKIAKARREAGLTQADLARRAGIRPETLNRIEKGHTTPNVATVTRIERALDEAESINTV